MWGFVVVVSFCFSNFLSVPRVGCFVFCHQNLRIFSEATCAFLGQRPLLLVRMPLPTSLMSKGFQIILNVYFLFVPRDTDTLCFLIVFHCRVYLSSRATCPVLKEQSYPSRLHFLWPRNSSELDCSSTKYLCLLAVGELEFSVSSFL